MPMLDLAFQLQGTIIPADHGYALYSALCRLVPRLHEAGQADSPWQHVAVHPINGKLSGNRQITLDSRSRLVVRADSSDLADLITLAGKQLNLAGSLVQITIPETRPLHPMPRLYARTCVIKGALDPDDFLTAANRQLQALDIGGEIGLRLRQNEQSLEGRQTGGSDARAIVRRTIRIHDKQIIGYAIEARGLNADESLRLQEIGLGGRRRFGCGVFVPARD